MNYTKFTQNPDLLKVMLEHEDLDIVEASPYDKIWGIGLSKEDPRAWNEDTWVGENLLGYAIMKARIKIKLELMIGNIT